MIIIFKVTLNFGLWLQIGLLSLQTSCLNLQTTLFVEYFNFHEIFLNVRFILGLSTLSCLGTVCL